MASLLFFQSLPDMAVAHIVWAFGDLSQHFQLATACTWDRNSVVLQVTGACFHNAEHCSALFSLKTVILIRLMSMDHRTV